MDLEVVWICQICVFIILDNFLMDIYEEYLNIDGLLGSRTSLYCSLDFQYVLWRYNVLMNAIYVLKYQTDTMIQITEINNLFLFLIHLK